MFVILEKNIAYKLFINKNENLFYRKRGIYYKVNDIQDLNNRVFLRLNEEDSYILKRMDGISTLKDTFGVLGAVVSSCIILTFVFLDHNNIFDVSLMEWWNNLNLKQQIALVVSLVITHFSWNQILFCSNFSEDYHNKYKKQKEEIIEKYI